MQDTAGPLLMNVPVLADQQELCTHTGCCLEDMQEAIDDRDEWQVRIREICASCST